MKRRILALLLSLVVLVGCLAGCELFEDIRGGGLEADVNKDAETEADKYDRGVYGFASVEGIPDYSGEAYVALNGNIPEFTEKEKVTKSYEFYSELDSLGRCGYTMACIGKDIMPTDKREDIASVKPSGWMNKRYDKDLVDGGYIYNRCHLIGFQLTGENANEKNLITGTRYLNIEGMLLFENMVADYVKETGNHVMYRVTPVFVGNNLLASGVKIEGWSVEDGGEGICFNVFSYNVQPGIVIDYATGDNVIAKEGMTSLETESETETEGEKTYILNTGTKKIHKPDCSSAKNTAESNKREYSGDLAALEAQGYSKCGICKPQ